MSTRLAAFLLATSTLVGCSTVNKAVEGAKEDWQRMSGSGQTEQTAAPATTAAAPAAVQAAAPAAAPVAVVNRSVHPRLAQAIENYGANYKDGKGNPVKISFNADKCPADVLAGKGPNPVLNRATPNAVQKQAEGAGWSAIGGLAGKIPGVGGTVAGRAVQTTRDAQNAGADATQRLCARLSPLHLQFLNADKIQSVQTRERTFTALEGRVPDFIRQVAAVESSQKAITERGTDQMQEDAARKLLQNVPNPLRKLGIGQ